MSPANSISTLTVPNDPGLLAAVGAFVARAAESAGLGYREVRELQVAVGEAVGNVFRHAYQPGEEAAFTVRCEKRPGAFFVGVHDMGAPYDVQKARGARGHHGLPIMLLAADRVRFVNLGLEGKEVQILKYLHSDRIESPDHEGEAGPTVDPGQITLRMMKPEDAAGVARCFYETYGYSYGIESVYYPDRLVKLNEAGLVLTGVAVGPDGQVLGTEAMERSAPTVRLFESGMAAVRPAFRGLGLAAKLSAFVAGQVLQRDCAGVWTACVTAHPYSQKMALAAGLKPCALVLGNTPATMEFRSMQAQSRQRGSVLFHYLDLGQGVAPTLFLPERHREIAQEIFLSFGWKPDLRSPEGASPRVETTHLAVDANVHRQRVFGRVSLYGADFPSRLRSIRDYYRIHDFLAVALRMPLNDPYAPQAVAAAEDLGFFFGGVFPGSGEGDAEIVLQYLNNVILDYDQIVTISDFGSRLKEYVRSQDPDHAADPRPPEEG